MAGPFYNGIKGTTAGTPGTGAFTPSAASAGFLAWSTVPTGWIGLVRYEDGSAWELSYSYWSSAALTRGTNQRVASSTGSPLSLTTAATATMVADANAIGNHPFVPARGLWPISGATTTPTAIGLPACTVTGTAGAIAIAGGAILACIPRSQSTSATTANAQAGYTHTTVCGVSNSNAGTGGWEFSCKFGANQLPTGPRLFVGMTSVTFVANTAEPSALVANCAFFGKDSADANIQLMTNNGTGGCTKIDTGIPLNTNALLDCIIWADPGSLTVKALLIDRTSGAVWYGTTATDTPINNAGLFPQCLGGLSATTGTAFILHFGGYVAKAGGA